MTQRDWIKKNYTDKGITPWICKCGNVAILHKAMNDKHEFFCNQCIKKGLHEN